MLKKGVHKYLIISILAVVLLLTLIVVLVKYSSAEEEMPVPTETYYITVEKKIKTKFKGSYRRTFNHKNDVHLQVAQSYGINPDNVDLAIDTLSGALQKIETCDYYALDELTHSHPFLVPKAKAALDSLGKAFCDTLQARGGGSYRFIITSVLRTEKDVKRLRRRNVNSTENSAHLYGTTVDITYRRFDKYNPQFIISDNDLRLLLAEILYNFQQEGRCYVKYEIKQGCFHITFR